MTVNDLSKRLDKIISDGDGELDIIAIDTRNGVSSNISCVDNKIRFNTDDYYQGTLIDYPEDRGYFSLYLDH